MTVGARMPRLVEAPKAEPVKIVETPKVEAPKIEVKIEKPVEVAKPAPPPVIVEVPKVEPKVAEVKVAELPKPSVKGLAFKGTGAIMDIAIRWGVPLLIIWVGFRYLPAEFIKGLSAASSEYAALPEDQKIMIAVALAIAVSIIIAYIAYKLLGARTVKK